ncbi:glutaredoxin family protein [Pseudoalteromonas sp. MMG010]|uniref:glutaredoxin family protein n=1 Tax=Pseudoalteromonas sp. MMG010 TaxID=2822685 RepID=UPI001B39EB7A|nr:glutaredoxin family protein [Pseudoalteromonas sp. MMG010]MBQ4832454.1 glutaredoxin family protein [Pseudoalteromonas sp. MMG010]
MANLTLYHTDGCHLCENALAIISAILTDDKLLLVDIISDEDLIKQYQTTIPVLKSDNEKQLFWPFDESAVIEFLRKEK